MGRRFCTSLYKIQVIDKAIRNQLGYKKGERVKHKVELTLGISYDERGRMKTPKEKWKSHRYPLVDQKLTRQDCKNYLDFFYKKYKKYIVKSACVFCPYKKNIDFIEMKKHAPKDFERAIEFDRSIRHIRKGVTQYVHRNCLPLEEAIKKTENVLFDFKEECEGMCGN